MSNWGAVKVYSEDLRGECSIKFKDRGGYHDNFYKLPRLMSVKCAGYNEALVTNGSLFK